MNALNRLNLHVNIRFVRVKCVCVIQLRARYIERPHSDIDNDTSFWCLFVCLPRKRAKIAIYTERQRKKEC